MKGLILKELYMVIKHYKGYILLVFCFAMLAGSEATNMFFMFYPCLICGMIPVNLMAYDERSKWDSYTAVLPFTRAQVVASKYMIGILAQLVILTISIAASMIRMAVSGNIDWNYLAGTVGTMILLSAVSTAVPLPFIFRMGVEKGRMGYYVMIGLAAGGSGVAAGIYGNEIAPNALPELAVPLMVLIGIGVYALSWYLSVRFYKKRDL